ncbi:agmatine deiminase family protein [Bacillus gobiensis]|uniref:agmatine deiminase family protein n=1 Tax=Bacillus gobiensis TaxID=1441095 RepID=UPI003D1DAD09
MNPSDLTYKMPPEWAQHERTLISWPIQESMIYPDDYDNVCKGYTELIQAISEFEPVTVIVIPGDEEAVASRFSAENIEILAIPHNDAWLRDNGPTFIINKNNELAGINWGFNAWGGKYEPWDLDDQVAPELLKHFGTKKFDASLVMEGGSIHVDGDGTLLTTKECLLNPNRNPDLTKEEIESIVKKHVNIEKVIWLNRGLIGDETDGHVDNVACFAAPGKVLIQVCDDQSDENYEISQENLTILRNATDAKGRTIEIIPIQQPPARHYNGKRLTLSYLNFYFVNGGIILPVFGGDALEYDKMAEEALQNVFPDYRIRKIDGMAVVKEGGNVHCTTQQMPAVSTRNGEG